MLNDRGPPMDDRWLAWRGEEDEAMDGGRAGRLSGTGIAPERGASVV